MITAAPRRDAAPGGAPPGALNGPGDYIVLRLLEEAAHARLLAEAIERAQQAGTSLKDALTPGDEHPPIHCLETASGGPALAAFLGGETTLEALARLTGRRWKWARLSAYGNYNYYRQPFHFDGLHRDREFCELTIVTCIHDDPGEGGDLVLFPSRVHDPLSAIRANPEEGAVYLRLQPGESLVFFGSAVAHAVTPIGPNRVRITAPACYQAL